MELRQRSHTVFQFPMRQRALSYSLSILALAPIARGQSASDQDSLEQRMAELEASNKRLESQLAAVSVHMESFEFRDVMPEVGASQFGMGPAASKVYAKDQGLSIGGYGEGVYSAPAGPDTASADFLRAILYVGYKFDDNWVFNSEIEVEHANEISVEFAYLEYLHTKAFNFRTGMLLVPMGLVNEMHEPTTFRGPDRPATERRIIPSTWRENGLGIVGDSGDLSYKFYALNGLDGSGFSASGLRGGRQKGSKAKAEDIALVGRLDWSGGHGLDLGLSAYVGDSGQGDPSLGDASTAVFDIHAQYQTRGLRLRGLFAQASVDDTETIFASTGEVVGEEMRGWYLEAGYDVASLLAPDGGHQVIPYVRYENINTHSKVADSLTSDPSQDDQVTTVGLDWKPIESIVFKAAYQDWDKAVDILQFSIGYVF
jgi:hypothetical protein